MKLRHEMQGRLYKITASPNSKYRSIDDPFDEDEKHFWILLEKKGSTFYISDCSLIDYDNELTAYALIVDGKQLFEFSYFSRQSVRFSNDTFSIASSSHITAIESVELIMEFLAAHTLITVSPTFHS
jgi:hypothetical protein